MTARGAVVINASLTIGRSMGDKVKTGILAFLAFLAALALGAPAMAQTVGSGTDAPPSDFVFADSIQYQGQTITAVNTNLSSVSVFIGDNVS